MKRAREGFQLNRYQDMEFRFPEAVNLLESAVHELLDTGWDERFRRRAAEIATAIQQCTTQTGWTLTQRNLRAIGSLLSFPLEEVRSLQAALRERLLDLLDGLKDAGIDRLQAQSR